MRGYGHNAHNANGVYSLDEVRQFLKLFPAGPVAVAIGLNAFLALRKPEVHALLPEDYDKQGGKIRIHRDTKTGNDEMAPGRRTPRQTVGRWLGANQLAQC